MRARIARFAALVAALASTASCTALVDLDQYELATCTELRLDLISFSGPHSTVPVEVRAADDMNRLSCLVRLVPFGSEDNLSIRVPHGLTTPASRQSMTTVCASPASQVATIAAPAAVFASMGSPARWAATMAARSKAGRRM